MIELYPWNPVEDLETEEDMAEYLESALEQDDDWGVAYVLSDISGAKGMEWAIASAWRDKNSIYKAEKRGDCLPLRAVMEAARALGFRLYAVSASCEESASVPNSNGGAAKTRRRLPSPNGKPAEDMLSRLNAALDHCDAWGAALALQDIAVAMGMERLVRDAESEKRGEMVDFAAFMDAARALGLRIHAAVTCGEMVKSS